MAILDPTIVDDSNTETRETSENLDHGFTHYPQDVYCVLGEHRHTHIHTPKPESVAEVLRSLVRLVFHPMTFSAEKRK